MTSKFQDLHLIWDARIEEKGKHHKFENIWKGPYKITTFHGKNIFILEYLQGESLPGGLVNGHFLKNYISLKE